MGSASHESTNSSSASTVAPSHAETGETPTTSEIPTSTASTLPVATTTIARKVMSATNPLKVMVVGDSLMFDATPGIVGAFEATHAAKVFEAGVPGFGLNRSYHWSEEWPRLLSEWHPDIVVMLEGGWDLPLRKYVGPARYQKLVDKAAETLTSTGAHLYWLELPQARKPYSYDFIDRSVNLQFIELAKTHADAVTFVPIEPALDPDGVFRVSRVDAAGALRVRKIDGAHFCADGAAALGRVLVDAAREHFDFPALVPGWESGLWRFDGRFNDPKGACTDPPLAKDP